MRIFARKPQATRTNPFTGTNIPGPTHVGQNRVVNSIINLQSAIGNQAVQRLMRVIQAKMVNILPVTNPNLVQRDVELGEKETNACLAKVEVALQELEATAAKPDYPLPDYIKEAIKLFRQKKTTGKIKCYAFSGIKHGQYVGDEIRIDGQNPDWINVTSLLHEAVHAYHGVKFPEASKKYSEGEGKPFREDDPKLPDLLRWKAYTEYWAYRARFDYFNPERADKDKYSDEAIHQNTMNDRDVRVSMMRVRQFDPNFDPRIWKK